MAYKFKVGDKVKIIENKWGSRNEVGDVGEIVEVYKSGYRVQVPGGPETDTWSIPIELELVKQATMTIHDQILAELNLKPGDIVKVTHKVPEDNLGWRAGWNDSMDDYIGQETEVVEVNKEGFGVRLKSSHTSTLNWNFPAQTIEFVRRGPEYKEMQISKDYSAKVYADKIEVGCQTITIEDFKKLQKLVNEMTKKFW